MHVALTPLGFAVARALAEAPPPVVRQIVLLPATAAIVRRPVVGRGGFQTLFRRIQGGLVGNVLTVAQADLDALVRLGSGAAGRRLGGYQHRAKALIVDVVMWNLRDWGPFAGRPPRMRVLPFARGPRQLCLLFEEDR